MSRTSSFDEVNRALNRALRALSDAANSAVTSDLEVRMTAVDELAQAMELVMGIQRRIYAVDPSLEFHHDSTRPHTAFMKKVYGAVESADEDIRLGDINSAREKLREALAMEPSPLAYEVINRKLASL